MRHLLIATLCAATIPAFAQTSPAAPYGSKTTIEVIGEEIKQSSSDNSESHCTLASTEVIKTLDGLSHVTKERWIKTSERTISCPEANHFPQVLGQGHVPYLATLYIVTENGVTRPVQQTQTVFVGNRIVRDSSKTNSAPQCTQIRSELTKMHESQYTLGDQTYTVQIPEITTISQPVPCPASRPSDGMSQSSPDHTAPTHPHP